MVESVGAYIAGAAFVLTLIVQAVSVMKYISGIRDTLQIQMGSSEKACIEKFESLRRETEIRIDNVAEKESKARHDLANNMMGAIGEVRRDSKTLEEKVSGVQRDMIRRSDLNETKQDIMLAIERSERNRTESFDKLEKRLNSMVDRTMGDRRSETHSGEQK